MTVVWVATFTYVYEYTETLGVFSGPDTAKAYCAGPESARGQRQTDVLTARCAPSPLQWRNVGDRWTTHDEDDDDDDDQLGWYDITPHTIDQPA